MDRGGSGEASPTLPSGLHLAGWRVLVLGLGITGVEVAKVLAEKGAEVLASESGAVSANVAADIAAKIPGVEIETGGHERARAGLDRFDFVFSSPGISPLGGFLAEVIARGRPVISELELGVALTAAPVVAVTGTNGKTTVCRLAESIGRYAGLEVHACGNLETKFLTAAFRHPDADAFVVEASSFSLAFCETFHPLVAVVTSLAPDHLDWHGTFDHYRDAKSRIAARQRPGELYLYPSAQPELEAFAPANGPFLVPFSGRPLGARPGAWCNGDEVVIQLNGTTLRADGAANLASRGEHFGADAAAAAAAMAFLGVGVDGTAIERALETFRFDPHRLEPVGSIDGVRVVDDSVATNEHATLAALRSFDEPVVLIAGGRNKGIDLSPLAEQAGRLRAVVALGEAAPDIERVFDRSSVFVSIAASMREAVSMAIEAARPGDVILLSPACASHDMFANYAERGRAFQDACHQVGVT